MKEPDHELVFERCVLTFDKSANLEQGTLEGNGKGEAKIEGARKPKHRKKTTVAVHEYS